MQDSVSIDREKFIGGSDIPIIMELSPFKSRFDLLLEKAGYKHNDFKGNVFTEYGNTMESKIRDHVNNITGEAFLEGKHICEISADWNVTPNGYKITLIPDSEDTVEQEETFNAERFMAEHPEIVEQYMEKKNVIKKGKKGYVRITSPKEESNGKQ